MAKPVSTAPVAFEGRTGHTGRGVAGMVKGWHQAIGSSVTLSNSSCAFICGTRPRGGPPVPRRVCAVTHLDHAVPVTPRGTVTVLAFQMRKRKVPGGGMAKEHWGRDRSPWLPDSPKPGICRDAPGTAPHRPAAALLPVHSFLRHRFCKRH